jgi:hypothetical protein
LRRGDIVLKDCGNRRNLSYFHIRFRLSNTIVSKGNCQPK